MNQKATITQKGAIILGKHVACDAYDENTPLRVVTHAHADHLIGLQQSLRTSEKVLMTSATKDLIDVMLSPLTLMSGNVETLEYEKPMRYNEETITFYPADHILGSAQVLVEDKEGTRIAYTSDFRIDNTPILETDTLVIEATYGSPHCQRPPQQEIKTQLITTVEKGLKQGTVYIFSYHGKLQEIMQILHTAQIKAPFITPERVFQITKICQKHGMHTGQILHAETAEAQQLLTKNQPAIAFHHINTKARIGSDKFRITVSGWEFNTPIRQTTNKDYTITLSDHSDYNGLIEYIRQSKPKQLITDNYREGHAQTLANETNKKLNIPAIALPTRK